jgi:hypothetical protein
VAEASRLRMVERMSLPWLLGNSALVWSRCGPGPVANLGYVLFYQGGSLTRRRSLRPTDLLLAARETGVLDATPSM